MIRILASAIALALVLICPGLSVALPSDEYAVTVSLLPCSKMQVDAASVHAFKSATPYRYKGRSEIPADVEKQDDGTLLIRLKTSRQHQFLWFDAGDCEAKVMSMSLDSAARSYVTTLGPSPAGNIEERDAYVAGMLPFAGVERVELIGAGQSASAEAGQVGVVDGRAFYFSSPRAGKFRVRVYLDRFSKPMVSEPFLTYEPGRPGAPFGLVMNLKLSDLSTVH